MDIEHMFSVLRQNLTCTICLDYFIEPVTVSCGHKFCKACVLRSFREGPTPARCPECRTVWKTLPLVVDKLLENLTFTGRRLRLNFLNNVGGPTYCNDHQKAQRLFCEDDQSLLCISCSLSEEHNSHQVFSLEKAAESCKEKLLKVLENLNEKTEQSEIVIINEKQNLEQFEVRSQTSKQLVMSEYTKMRQLLVDHEKQHLECLNNEMRENWEELLKNKAKASRYSRHLQKMIEELENHLEKPVSGMLLGARSILERSQALILQCPQATSQEWPSYQIPGMRDMLMTFQRDITLDPETANPHLLLSEDLKSVEFGSTVQDVPDNPKRFDHAVIVLGAQKFMSGRHYWEVEMGDKTEWSVGICRESICRKSQSLPADVFSITAFKVGNDFILWVHDIMKGFLMPKPVHKIGIFLDYEYRHIAFYNVTSKSLIYSLQNVDFQEPLQPFFSPCKPNKDSIIRPLIICPMVAHP